jgi:peptidoglycan-associated lipoprotein
MRTKLSALLLSIALAACSHSRSQGSSDTVPAAPEFSEAGSSSTIVESNEMSASNADNAIPPDDQIFFKNDSDKLNADGQAALTDVARWVMAAPGRQIVLEGHADANGATGHNLDLSSRRAMAAATFLKSLQVPDERIVITAVGENDAKFMPGRSNRRVLIFATETEAAAYLR